MKNNTQPTTNKYNQAGLVSIVIVTIVVILLSLVSIAFARVMTRTLRQALDRDLSAQAYYAAESGLNDARIYVINQLKAGSTSVDKSDCDPPNVAPFVNSGTYKSISGDYNSDLTDDNVKYPLRANRYQASPSYRYSQAGGESKILRITTAGLRSLYFGWNNTSYNADPLALDSLGNYPQESALIGGTNPDKTGVVRASIYPVQAGATSDAAIASDSRTYFFCTRIALPPISLEGLGIVVTVLTLRASAILQISPNSPFKSVYAQLYAQFCNSQIGRPGDLITPYGGMLVVRLTALYQPLTISMMANTSGLPSDAGEKIEGVQAVIDVTGEGNDVLRRIQARVPLTDNLAYPQYALQSMETLCKRLRLAKTGPGPASYIFDPTPGAKGVDDDPSPNADEAACKPL